MTEATGDAAGVIDSPADRRPRRALLLALKVLVSGTLIFWILQGTPVREILAAMRTAAWPLLLTAFLLNFVGYAISVTRWKVLLEAQGVRAPYRYLLPSYMIAIFFNNVLPSTIGGDTFRAYDSWRLARSKSRAVAVIFTDRFLGMLALLTFAIVAVFLAQRIAADVPLLRIWLALTTVAMLAVLWALLVAPARLAGRLARLPLPGAAAMARFANKASEAFAAYRGSHGALKRGFALSLLLQTNVVLYYYLIGQALGFPVPFHTFFLIVPLSLAVMAVPISINAIGIRESVFAFFFSSFGVGTADAVAFAWLAYGLTVIHGLIGGIVYASRR